MTIEDIRPRVRLDLAPDLAPDIASDIAVGTGAWGAIELDPIEAALDALRRGLPVLVVDDADRENEGDVIIAAQHATTPWMAWTIRHTSGVLCVPVPADLADRLELPPMVARNEDPKQTAYTVSVDAARGVSTGISAADRARTAQLIADPATTPADLTRPGHMFPLRARDGGVLQRRGHTEAGVDLCRLAGLAPVAVIAEVVEDDGGMARLPSLRALADAHGLPLVSIADLVAYRLALNAGAPALNAGAAPVGRQAHAPLAMPAAVPVASPARVQRLAQTALPTRHGTLRALAYRDLLTGQSHVALLGRNVPARGALVRVHSECLTGDGFGSQRCDCGPQLEAALEVAAAEGGAVVYLRGHEGRGIGLAAKLFAYELQDHGLDTVAANIVQGLPADAREYGAAAAVLADLGLNDVRLLTNNPAKVAGLAAHGVRVRERVALQVGRSEHNAAYLDAKRDLMGHALETARVVDPGIEADTGLVVEDALGAGA